MNMDNLREAVDYANRLYERIGQIEKKSKELKRKGYHFLGMVNQIYLNYPRLLDPEGRDIDHTILSLKCDIPDTIKQDEIDAAAADIEKAAADWEAAAAEFL